MKPKITHKEAAMALLALAFLLAYANGTQARAGPKITPTHSPTATEMATVTPSPSNPPEPTSTETPTRTPTATQTPTPTDAGIEVSASIVIDRCLYFKKTVEFWVNLEPDEYLRVTMEHVPIILGIMAEESGCDKRVDVSYADAVGLM